MTRIVDMALCRRIISIGMLCFPALALAIAGTVTAPAPGRISGLRAPWSIDNGGTITVPGNLGFTVQTPTFFQSTIFKNTAGTSTINIQAGAVFSSSPTGEAAIMQNGGGTSNINIAGSLYSTGFSRSNNAIFATAGTSMNVTLTGAGNTTGVISINSGVTGTFSLEGTGGCNVGTNGSGTSFLMGDNYVLQFKSTGTITADKITTSNTGNTSSIIVGAGGSSSNITLNAPVINVNNIQTTSTGTLTTNGNFSGISTSFANAGVTNISNNNVIAGNGTLNNSGTLTINSGSALRLNGTITNSGTINVLGELSIVGATNITGNLNINGTGFLAGTGGITGGAGSVLTIGKTTSGTNVATNFTLSKPVSGIRTIALQTVGTTLTTTSTAPITNLDTLLSLSSSNKAFFNGNVSGAAAVVTSGGIVINPGATFALSGSLTNQASIDIFGTYAPPSNMTGNISNIFFCGTSAALSGSNPISGTGAASFYYGMDSVGVTYPTTNYTTANNFTIPYIYILYGTFTQGTTRTISNLRQFRLSPGLITNLNAGISGTSSIVSSIYNEGTLNFLTASSMSNITLNMYKNSIVNFNTGTTTVLTSAPIAAAGGSTNTTMNIIGNTTVQTNSAITGLTTVNIANNNFLEIGGAVSNITNLSIGTGSKLTLKASSPTTYGTISSIGTLTVNGTLQIDAGTYFTLDSGNKVVGTGAGLIDNFGQLTLNGANVTFPGGFINESTGTLTLDGLPTLSFTSTTTFTNQGYILANFSPYNSLPQLITAATNPDMSHGTIIVGYNNNYIAGGKYRLFTATGAASEINAGIAILPQPSTYISEWNLISDYIPGTGSVLEIEVTRDGFDQHALTPTAQSVGAYLEAIGSSGTTSISFLSLLNSLEHIDNDAELTEALDSLLPPQNTTLANIQNVDAVLGVVDLRLATVHHGLAYGNEISADKYGFWVRPFSADGTQQTSGSLNGYSDSSHGIILGFDRGMTDNLLVGLAGSITKTSIDQFNSENTHSNVNSYDFTIYGTYTPSENTYVDALMSGGVSNFHNTRVLTLPGINAYGSSNYSNQQLTLKTMVSRLFPIKDTFQITPSVMAQYSFIRQAQYTEQGLGPYNVFTDPDNVNLFRLGAGTAIGMPFTTREIISIPSVYAMVYCDAKGGAVTSNTMFISGGPIITSTVQQSRLMLKLGASYELKLNENFEVIANYDYLVRHGFQGHEAFINLRYIF